MYFGHLNPVGGKIACVLDIYTVHAPHQVEEEEILVTGGGGGSIKGWRITNLEHDRLDTFFKFQDTNANALSLTSSASFLYAGFADGTAHIYNLASCQLIQKLHVGPNTRVIKVSYDGSADSRSYRQAAQYVRIPPTSIAEDSLRVEGVAGLSMRALALQ